MRETGRGEGPEGRGTTVRLSTQDPVNRRDAPVRGSTSVVTVHNLVTEGLLRTVGSSNG